MEEKRMNVKEFSKLKKEVKAGNLEVLKEDIVRSFTLRQAEEIDNEVFNHEIPDYLNPILDILVSIIQSGKAEGKKVASNKNLKAPKKDTKKEGKKEDKKPAKKPAKKEGKKEDKKPAKKITDKIEVGDIVKFQVEGEEIQHDIKIVYKGKYNIIGVMAEDEKEVFNIRKSDFNKQAFAWTDRHNETYNIIVTL